MTNLQILDEAVKYTNRAFIDVYKYKMDDDEELKRQAANYSGSVLTHVILYSKNGTSTEYTRKNNLRASIALVGPDGIKNELLKNAVNVALWHRQNDTLPSYQVGCLFDPTMTDDEISVVIFNNIVEKGATAGYDLLNNKKILDSVCRTFALYRDSSKKKELDLIATNNKTALFINNEIDTHYARYGIRPTDSLSK